MSDGITFIDKKEALEYARTKEAEGYRTTSYKTSDGKTVVRLLDTSEIERRERAQKELAELEKKEQGKENEYARRRSEYVDKEEEAEDKKEKARYKTSSDKTGGN